MRKLFLLFTLLLATATTCHASEWYDLIAKTPVQHGGRIKPFESFARESVLYVTGKPNPKGFSSSTEAVLAWMASPEIWYQKPIIYISSLELREEFGLMVMNKRVSPENVLSHQKFLDGVSAAKKLKEEKESLTFLDKKRIELYEKATYFNNIGQGYYPGWIPHPENPEETWMSFALMGQGIPASWGIELPREAINSFLEASQKWILTLRNEKSTNEQKKEMSFIFNESIRNLWTTLDIEIDLKKNKSEVQYNGLNPFGWGWKLYLIGALLLILSFKSRYFSWAGLFLIIIGFLLHSYGFYLRCVISGRAPVTNMYESVVWVSWAVVFFSLIIYGFLKYSFVLWVAGIVASLGLLVAQSFPVALDASLSPLVPVLRSNLWLTVHVLTITLSYGAFALAWGLGHGVVAGYAFRKENKKPEWLSNLSTAVYRSMQIGVLLLATGTVLGGVWANYSWGRFWGWDPKETWALIALLGYLVVLHGRFAGWFGSFGVAAGAIIAFAGIIMAWYGVNFVLAAGLHSYGFGGGGFEYVSAIVFLDMFFVGMAAFFYQRSKK